MENKLTTISICLAVGLCGFGIMINWLYNNSKNELEVVNTTETSTSSTTILETTKTTKKIVKTTKKKTTIKKVKIASYSEYQSYAKSYGNYDDTQMGCLINLWNRESGWSPNSYNKKSNACGIPQAKPCSKISKSEGSNDWKAQIRWGIKYINARYKTPCNAWKHFQSKHWY